MHWFLVTYAVLSWIFTVFRAYLWCIDELQIEWILYAKIGIQIIDFRFNWAISWKWIEKGEYFQHVPIISNCSKLHFKSECDDTNWNSSVLDLWCDELSESVSLIKDMEFLIGTKQILRYLDVYTRPPINLGFTKISCHFIEYFAFISMLVTTIPIGAFCYVHRSDFQTASAGVLYFIANSSIKIIYLAFLLKRTAVINAIDHLSNLMMNSMDFYSLILTNTKLKEQFSSRDQFK